MRRAVSSLAVVLALATGCFASKETREGADKLENAIGTPSWAASVEVDTSVSGLSDDVVLTLVVLKDDATADEITDFVMGHPDRVDDAGLGVGFGDLQFATTKGATLTVPAADSTDADLVRDAVARWQGVLPVLGIDPRAELSRTTGGSAYTAAIPGGAAEIAALFQTLRDDADLVAPADSWSVSSVAGDLTMSLTSPTLPTVGEVRAWVALVDAVDLLPTRFRATELSLQRHDPHAGVDLRILMPGDVTGKNITPASYGDELWPVLQAQLRAIAGLDGGWSYLVQWAPQDLPDHSTIMLSLLAEKEPIDNKGDPATLWSKQAREYVDGL